ncbi:hypothetical protein chiPu_0007350 [Chiloscyllium punctatum]|uniref:Macro domain-containing protein n=1 Tax=Chiloscyllium punctatum TaxID=137246 RepID=A0A401SES6_CHIPU|nr:hypothetical protein [Chiloscyllium punctatum]
MEYLCSFLFLDVIHTVGPIARGSCDERLKRQLRNCYEASLKLLETQGLKSIAFPCISTGIYGFPQDDAAEIAVSTVKEWLTEKQALNDFRSGLQVAPFTQRE